MNILISEADGESTSRDSNCSRCHCYFGDSRRRGDGGSAGSGHHVDGVGGYHRRDASPMAGRDGGTGVAAGLATGPIIGGQLTAPRYYEPFPDYLDDYPPRYGGPVGYGSADWEAYCFSRYRSFDPISGTYQGRDGHRHYCQ